MTHLGVATSDHNSEIRVHVYNIIDNDHFLAVKLTSEGMIIDAVPVDAPGVDGTECREWSDILYELTQGGSK